jgi:hypothetical protein
MTSTAPMLVCVSSRIGEGVVEEEILVRDADCEVRPPVPVEVAGRERPAEGVVGLGVVGDPRGALHERPVEGARAKPPGGSVDHRHGPGVPDRPDVLVRSSDGQIGEAVPVEVAVHRPAEGRACGQREESCPECECLPHGHRKRAPWRPGFNRRSGAGVEPTPATGYAASPVLKI